MPANASQCCWSIACTYFQSPGPQLLYRGILLPFSTNGNAVDAILGLFRSREARDPARRSLSGMRKAATTLGPEPVAVEETRSVPAESAIEFRAATKRARQSIGSAEIEEQSKVSAVRRLSIAVAGTLRGALWPSRVTQITRNAPAIGRALVWEEASSEFALLLARRVDAEAGRYEVLSATELLLLNLAMRLAARKLARSTSEHGQASASVAAARLRNNQPS